MNLFWNADGQPPKYAGDMFGGRLGSPKSLKKRVCNLFSLVTDPKFADPEHDNQFDADTALL